MTVKVYYDPAVFKTEAELKTQGIHDVQAYIEEPEIYIIAMSSSSIENQAALISNRLSCISEMKETVSTKNNIAIKDRLMFFTGDKPASQFERGTQVGGNYPRGSGGSHVKRLDDFAYCSIAKMRSLQRIAVYCCDRYVPQTLCLIIKGSDILIPYYLEIRPTSTISPPPDLESARLGSKSYIGLFNRSM